jgi:superfamily I DNA/RNA helicase
MRNDCDCQQLKAVMTPHKQVLCLAGAGAGKTRVIVERIAHLIEDEHISPFEVMAVSFTRKASNELKERIIERVGPGARKIVTGTIHSIALRYLRQFGELIGWKAKNLTVYSEFEEDFLLKECARDLGVYNGKAWKPSKREIQEAFDTYYQEGVEPEEDHPGRRVFDELRMRCSENNSMTYGGLLIEFYKLLPKIAQYLHLKHIFVDEVQDLDLLQHKLFENLVELTGASMFYVGDLDQSIYSWRGAVPEYLIENQADFEIFKIETNYRSDPRIVEAANKLIEHNSMRIPRDMIPSREDGGEKALIVYREMDSEAVVKKIAYLLENHWSDHSEMAILGRNHFLLKKIAGILDVVKLPYTYIGRTNELIGSEIFRKVNSFLKLLVNPYDNFSFLLIKDLLGLSRQQYNEIRLKATQTSKSHFETWNDLPDLGPQEFNEFFWGEYSDFTSRVDDFLMLMEEAGIPEEDLSPIHAFIAGWIKENPNGNMEDYLDWLSVFDLQDEIKDEDTKLKLMTIHAAKGLEWPRVILIGVNEGILPSKQSIEGGDLESERRLMYVAITRARDSLILAVRPEVKDDGVRRWENPVSRFIKELQ